MCPIGKCYAFTDFEIPMEVATNYEIDENALCFQLTNADLVTATLVFLVMRHKNVVKISAIVREGGKWKAKVRI